MATCACVSSAARRARPRSSEELDRRYCGSKAHGANSKSQRKGLPCRAHFSPLDLALDFLALHFLMKPFDIGKRLIDAVSGARHRARPPATGVMVLHVHGVRSDRGHVMFVLYGDKPEEFLVKGKKIFKQRFAASQGTVDFCVNLPKPGIYAAVAYHDENDNRKFDKNWAGLPVEGAGVSNNPKTFLGSPSHDQAAFTVSHGLTKVDIEIKY